MEVILRVSGSSCGLLKSAPYAQALRKAYVVIFTTCCGVFDAVKITTSCGVFY